MKNYSNKRQTMNCRFLTDTYSIYNYWVRLIDGVTSIFIFILIYSFFIELHLSRSFFLIVYMTEFSCLIVLNTFTWSVCINFYLDQIFSSVQFTHNYQIGVYICMLVQKMKETLSQSDAALLYFVHLCITRSGSLSRNIVTVFLRLSRVQLKPDSGMEISRCVDWLIVGCPTSRGKYSLCWRHCWPWAVFCSFVGLLSLRHIPRFYSQFYVIHCYASSFSLTSEWNKNYHTVSYERPRNFNHGSSR